MTRLGAEEGDGESSVERNAAHPARIAVDAGRHVDRDDRHPAFIDAFDCLRGRTFHVAGEPCAEDRIDDERSTAAGIARQRMNRARPAIRREFCVALQCIAMPEQEERDRPALLREKTRDDEAVAAIVARPAQHGHRSLREALDDCLSHRAARILHKGNARRAALDGKRIGAAHLGDGEEFKGSAGAFMAAS